MIIEIFLIRISIRSIFYGQHTKLSLHVELKIKLHIMVNTEIQKLHKFVQKSGQPESNM